MLEEIFGTPQRHVTLVRGERLFGRGDSADAVFTVVSGRLRLERTLEDGALVTLSLVRPGDGLAEAALFADCYHCDAVAEVQSRLACFSKVTVLERLGADPQRLVQLSARLAGQVRRLRAVMEVRSVRRADQRVMAYLDLLAALEESWDDRRPTSAVAAELGLTPEALYRALRRLEKDDRIVRKGRAVDRKD